MKLGSLRCLNKWIYAALDESDNDDVIPNYLKDDLLAIRDSDWHTISETNFVSSLGSYVTTCPISLRGWAWVLSGDSIRKWQDCDLNSQSCD